MVEGADINEQKHKVQYSYHFSGESIKNYVWASEEQINKARAYFQKENWKFPQGIVGVGIFKNGSLEFSIDYKAKNEGKKSIENLGLPSPY